MKEIIFHLLLCFIFMIILGIIIGLAAGFVFLMNHVPLLGGLIIAFILCLALSLSID